MAASISGMIKNPHQATECLLGLPQHDMVWLAGRVAAAATSQQDAPLSHMSHPHLPQEHHKASKGSGDTVSSGCQPNQDNSAGHTVLAESCIVSYPLW
jgi:hypothetical protein